MVCVSQIKQKLLNMNKFKKNTRSKVAIPTSSLPDIVFMLLFFFMVTTIVRPNEILVKQQIPKATQLKKIKKKSLVVHFNIGAPKNADQFGRTPRVQLNGAFIEVEQIPQLVEEIKTSFAESEKNKLIMSLKIDNEVKMGIVNDVEEQLKKVNARKIIYNTTAIISEIN